jgi:fucose permease
MKNIGIKISLFLNYFVFAILLNSVGAVILQVQRNFDITKSDASILEGFKDLPIAITSFIVASFLPRLGIKKGMLIGLFSVAILCFMLPLVDADFWYFKILFLVIGVSFAIVKVSVFSVIGLISDGPKEHSSLMSWIEGFFMVGVLFGNVFFSWFIDDNNPKSESWLQVYWWLGALSILAAVLLFFTKLDEREAVKEGSNLGEDISSMFSLMIKPLILVFVLSVFLYVLIEQSFQTWMPTFYQEVLSLPTSMSIQAGAILAGAFATGRIIAGFVLIKMKWFPFSVFCLVALALCVFVMIPMTQGIEIGADISWWNAPLVVYIFPIMGIFLSPIYPTINSTVLSTLPKYMHSSMAGLIVVFSALGGTTGSIITGHVFEHFDGRTAFYLSLVPIGLSIISLFIFYRLQIKKIPS